MKNKLNTNFIYNFINRIIMVIIPLITTPYITRTLGATKLGMYSYANTIASYFVMFAAMGISIHGARAIAASKSHDTLKAEFSTLRMVQIINSLLVILAYFIYIFLWNNDNFIMSLIQVLYIISAIFDVTWFYSGIEKFKYIAIRNVLINCISTVCIFLFVKSQSDLIIYAIIKTSTLLISQFVLCVSSHKYFKINLIKKNKTIYYYKQMLMLFFPVAIESIVQTIDKVMLKKFVSYAAVGLYYTSRLVTDIPQCMITSLNTIAYPRIVALKKDGFLKKANEVSKTSFYIINVLCIAMCFGIVAISENFVNIFFRRRILFVQRIYIIANTLYLIGSMEWNSKIPISITFQKG